MEIPVDLDPNEPVTLQNQLFEQLRTLILKGQLKPGAMVPATRALAHQLGVSRNTVVISYDRLTVEGYLETRRAIGTFVSRSLPEETLNIKVGREHASEIRRRQALRQPLPFKGRAHAVVNPNRPRLICDFWVGRPDPNSFPIKTWRKLLTKHLLQAGPNLTEYRDPAGFLGLRQAIVNRLGPTRGINVTPDQVIIVTGCQEAFNIVARLFIQKGTPAIVENPCYQGAAYVLESYGAALRPVPIDEHGIDVSQLPEEHIRVAYVTPSHQYPVGSTLSLERRLLLLEWAWRVGAYILEDDYDSDFRYHGSPLMALRGLDERGCVLYIATFSKAIGAGLRLGYLVVPKELVEPAVTIKTLLNNGNAWLDQAVLAEFLSSGKFDTHVRHIRKLYLLRRDCLIRELRKHFGDVKLSGMKGGMHVLWHLPPGFPPACELQQMALDVGVGIYCMEGGGAHEFVGSEYGKSTIMLGYSSVTEEAICRGIACIADAITRWSARQNQSSSEHSEDSA